MSSTDSPSPSSSSGDSQSTSLTSMSTYLEEIEAHAAELEAQTALLAQQRQAGPSNGIETVYIGEGFPEGWDRDGDAVYAALYGDEGGETSWEAAE
ncbi:hypothetical protein P7C73_g6527, partial [Tremellales sp. Uapishka_1]